MQAQTLEGGFADTAREASYAFRGIMEAMARPGTIHALTGAQAPKPISVAAATVLLTLCDADTPVCLAHDVNHAQVRDWLAFHTSAPLVEPDKCMFALGSWEALLPLSQYPLGTSQYPDRSATLIVECTQLTTDGATIRGPGIPETASLSLPDIECLVENHRHFPRGLDFLFTCGDRIAALPRSTRIQEKETG